MPTDKPVHARNVPTPTDPTLSRGEVAPDEVAAATGQRPPERGTPPDATQFATEARLKAAAESRPVSGTPSRPHADQPGRPLRSRTKVQDPADAAAQTRAATPPDPTPHLRNQ